MLVSQSAKQSLVVQRGRRSAAPDSDIHVSVGSVCQILLILNLPFVVLRSQCISIYKTEFWFIWVFQCRDKKDPCVRAFFCFVLSFIAHKVRTYVWSERIGKLFLIPISRILPREGSKGRDKSAVRIFSVRQWKNMSNGKKNTAKVEGVFTGVCA